MRYSEEDKNEFLNLLKELEELNLIGNSTSPHSSSAFMVRNHTKISRGKARMIIKL